MLVSIGGDVAACGSAPRGGWQIHVTDDHRSGREAPGQTIVIRAGGLATSSTSVRRWSHAGRTMHHIIDPHTGRAGTRALAHRERRRAGLCAGEHRDHRRTGTRHRLDRLADATEASGAPGRLGRSGDHRRRLAGRRGDRGADAEGGAMNAVLAASGGSAYWYLTRSTGGGRAAAADARDRARRGRRAPLEHAAVAALHRRLAAPQRLVAGDDVPRRARHHLGARQLRTDLAARRVRAVCRLPTARSGWGSARSPWTC